MPRKSHSATSRPKAAGDDTYNARKRYARSAQRKLQRAQETSGAESARLKRLAELDFRKALETYDPNTATKKQKFLREIVDVGTQLGYDLSNRQFLIGNNQRNRDKIVQQSFGFLEGALQDQDLRREREARAIINSPIGSRIIGGLEPLWRDKATVTDEQGRGKIDQTKILPVLYEQFGVSKLPDLLTIIEGMVGETLYSEGGTIDWYKTVKLQIGIALKRNELVQ